jgi:flagellar basal-body rod protein FlgG
MLRSLWVAKTGMDAQQTNLDTISNNLANVSTTAYKRVRPIFEDLLYQNIRAPGLNEDSGNYVPAGLQAGNGARIAATQRINSSGSLVQSQNPLDMAINGNGFFAVSTPNGVAYTRAGNFMRNDKGQIVTASGNVLLGQSSITSGNANAAGIVIPSKATSVSIGSDGTVSYNLADLSAPCRQIKLPWLILSILQAWHLLGVACTSKPCLPAKPKSVLLAKKALAQSASSTPSSPM